MASDLASLDPIVDELAAAGWKERDAVKTRLHDAAAAISDRDGVLERLESLKKALTSLELRWELDEVIEALTPEPEPEPVEEQEEPPAEKSSDQLTAADLVMVYDDPRGLVLHKTKVGDRWFATQRNPQTGQPQTFQLQPSEVDQLKTQLDGSPYWVLGAGGAGGPGGPGAPGGAA